MEAKIITKLIAAILTVLMVSLVTLDISTATATILSFIGFLFLSEKIVSHIQDKRLPKVLEWVRYALVLVANILLIAGLKYRSITCLIVAIVSYVSSLICGYFNKKASI